MLFLAPFSNGLPRRGQTTRAQAESEGTLSSRDQLLLSCHVHQATVNSVGPKRWSCLANGRQELAVPAPNVIERNFEVKGGLLSYWRRTGTCGALLS